MVVLNIAPDVSKAYPAPESGPGNPRSGRGLVFTLSSVTCQWQRSMQDLELELLNDDATWYHMVRHHNLMKLAAVSPRPTLTLLSVLSPRIPWSCSFLTFDLILRFLAASPPYLSDISHTYAWCSQVSVCSVESGSLDGLKLY